MPGSKLRETQKPTAAIRQRTLNFRLRLNLISRLVTQSQSCEWLPKLQNPRRNQYKPSHIIWVYKLYGSQTVLCIANQNWSRELILICTCSIICDIQSIVKTRSIDFSLSELLMLLFTPFSVTRLWKTTETKPSRSYSPLYQLFTPIFLERVWKIISAIYKPHFVGLTAHEKPFSNML